MIQHNKPTTGKSEVLPLKRIIESGMLAQGEQVKEFEKEIGNFLDLPFDNVVCVSSGSAALYISLIILFESESKKRVGIPAYSCSSLWHAARLAKTNPIVLDIDKNSVNIDLTCLSNSDVNAAIVPHMYGLPIKINSENFSFPIIEDCAQSIGAILNNKVVGKQTEISTFSFYATKLITSGGQGGAIVVRNTKTAELARDIRDFDCKPINKARFNFQMTDLQASIGCVQLLRLNEFISKREKLFSKYISCGIKLIGGDTNISENYMPVRYRAVHITEKPDKLIKFLFEKSIHSIIPINDWELLAGKKIAPNAHYLSKRTVSLPLYPSLKLKEVEHIADTINNYYKKYPDDCIN